jgi:hypothetical protein
VAEDLAEVGVEDLVVVLPVDPAVIASVQIVAIGNHINLVSPVIIKSVLNAMHL